MKRSIPEYDRQFRYVYLADRCFMKALKVGCSILVSAAILWFFRTIPEWFVVLLMIHVVTASIGSFILLVRSLYYSFRGYEWPYRIGSLIVFLICCCALFVFAAFPWVLVFHWCVGLYNAGLYFCG